MKKCIRFIMLLICMSLNMSADDIEKYTKNCDCEDTVACGLLALIYSNGHNVRQDYAKSAKFLAKACDCQDTGACILLATMHSTGQGVRKNYLKASKLYKRACDYGNAKGCTNYAELNMHHNF